MELKALDRCCVKVEFVLVYIKIIEARYGESSEELIMKVIRLHQVMEMTGLGRSTVYKYVSESWFPKPISLGGRSVGWLESEVVEWVMARVSERDVRAGELG